MKLRELDARFLADPSKNGHRIAGDVFAGSSGIMFLCPKCAAENKSKHGDHRYGTHSVICWWVGVDPSIHPAPGRWTPRGTGLDDLTFVPSEGRTPSVQLGSGCMWHGYATDGDAS